VCEREKAEKRERERDREERKRLEGGVREEEEEEEEDDDAEEEDRGRGKGRREGGETVESMKAGAFLLGRKPCSFGLGGQHSGALFRGERGQECGPLCARFVSLCLQLSCRTVLLRV